MSYGWNVHINRFWILILWLLYVNSVTCLYWLPSLPLNTTRFRRQNKCNFDQFTCTDGSCITDVLQCDGKTDCANGSDETSDCKEIPCNPAFGYECEYGACVKKDARCNGITDCRDNSDEVGCTNVGPIPTTNSCLVTQFACHSGECIIDEQLCDGKADCSDNSDETREECSELQCINGFRCRYGACVLRTARCNGAQECFDGSDEVGCPNRGNVTIKPVTSKPPTKKPPTKPTDGSCIVPNVPTNGVFVNSNNPSGTFKPGEYVPNFNALITKCDRKFKISPPNKGFPVCLNGVWTSPPLQCASFCKSANSTKNTKITCRLGGHNLDSCIDPVEGTIASIECEYLFEGQSGNPTRICRDGSWDYPIVECRPVCGQKRPVGTPNIIGGGNARQGDYPWHIGIYANNEEKTHLCGGSIINQVVAISAAHCFTDNDGFLLAKENYLIAAGKYYRPYADDRDENTAQYSTIKEVHKPPRYRGQIGNYEADIAVIVLSKPLTISVTVQPVCVDWNTEFEYQQLTQNSMGVVVGWGYTQSGSLPSIELKELNISYISYEQCFDQVPKDFRRLLTYDKICAGFLNKGIAVCQGDSGGGLTFPRYDYRFYIRGVVSTSPRSENSCDPDQYATYTLISRHIDFIKEIEILNRI